MNCKQGDIAVVLRDPYCGNVDVGKLVDVVKFDGYDGDGEPCWWCRGIGSALACYTDGYAPARDLVAIPDPWLKPIRNDPGEDETLRWAGLPHKETA